MSSDTPPPASNVPTEPTPPAPRKRRWLRRLVIGVGVIVVLLLLLVVLLPTILSSGFATNIIAGQVQKNVLPKGRVEISDISLGWFSGQKVDGIKLFDADNRQMVLASFDTQLTLLDAARQKFNIRNTNLALELTRLVYYSDGTTNLDHAAGAKPGQAPPPLPPSDAPPAPRDDKPAPPPAKSEPIEVPFIAGDINMKLSGSVEIMDDDNKLANTIQLRPSTLHIDLKNMNAGVPVQAAIAYAVGSGKESKLDLDLTADAIENNILLLDRPSEITAKGFVKLTDVDLAPADVVAAMAKSAPQHLSGIANGKIDIDFKGKGVGGTDGEIVVDNFRAAPDTLNGDVITFARVTMPLRTSFSTSADGPVLDLSNVGIYGDDQLVVALSGSIPQSIIDNLAAEKAPNGEGWIRLLVQLNQPQKTLAMVANTVGLASDTKIEGGVIELRSDVNFKKATVEIIPTAVASLRGTRGGTAVKLEPITFLAKANFDGQKPLDDKALEQATFDLSSSFIKTGGTITSELTTIKHWFDLGLLKSQLAQFIDLSTLDLSGLAYGDLDLTGNILTMKGPLKFEFSGNTKDLVYASEGTKYLDRETLTYDGEGVLEPSEKTTHIKLDRLAAGAQSGLFSVEMTKPIDLTIGESGIPVGTGSLKLSGNAARFAAILSPPQPDQVSLKTGLLDGTLDFIANSDGTSNAMLKVLLHKLTDTKGNAYADITLDSDSSVNAPKTQLTAKANVKADFGTIDLTDVELTLADDKGVAPEGVAMLKQAKLASSITLAKLDAVASAFTGTPNAIGYAGEMTIDQSLTTQGNVLAAKGSIKLAQLAPLDPKAPAMAIRDIDITNDATVDTVAENIKANSVRIQSPQSQDLFIELTGGINQYATAQVLDNVKFNLKLDDWAKLWPLVKPIVDPEGSLEPLVIAGRVNETWTATGSLADIRKLNAVGQLPFEKLSATGASFDGPIVFKFRVKNGFLEFTDASGKVMEPLPLNKGKLNLGGLAIDLAPNAGATISAPKKHYLVQKLELNPLLAAKMGKYISVLFTDPQKASGTVDLTIERMRNIPLADITSSREGAKFVLSVRPIAIDSVVAKQVAGFSHLGTEGFVGEIKDAPIELKNGRVSSDITFTLFMKDKNGKTIGLPFVTTTNLDVNSLSLAGTSFRFPSSLLRSSDLTKFVGDTITVPVAGTTATPAFDIGGAVKSNLLNSDNLKDNLFDLIKKRDK